MRQVQGDAPTAIGGGWDFTLAPISDEEAERQFLGYVYGCTRCGTTWVRGQPTLCLRRACGTENHDPGDEDRR